MTNSSANCESTDSAGRPFTKMHGLRNHFVIVDAREIAYRPETAEIINICDPQTGVGADQLVVIEPPRSNDAQAFMRLLNMDGREVEACGNATRCVAWLLMEEFESNEVQLETLAGILNCHRAGELQVSCGMGKVSMDWQKIPLSREQNTLHLNIESGPLKDAAVLNVGNPHAVFFVNDLDAIDLQTLAPPIQKNTLFPNEVNVGAAQIINDTTMHLLVYERGAGLTTACGSGACAAVYAAIARGLTASREMTVKLPGGQITIEIHSDDTATMTGPVAYSFSGFLPIGNL